MKNQIKIFCPATVANVSCGFDAMGFALEAVGDEMTFTKTETKAIRITKINVDALPTKTDKNCASAVAKIMLEDAKADFGVDIEIHKGYKSGSGLGSSASSSAGAVFAINYFLNNHFTEQQCLKYAMYGEQVACGSPIADNVSACLLGGFVLIRSYDPLDVRQLPVPKDLMVSVIHPQIEIKTQDARDILPKDIPMTTAITQWANVGGLVSGLYENDYDLIGQSLIDVVVEPYRKALIPNFDIVKENALQAGALGVGISGSGPSIFALSKGLKNAKAVSEAMSNSYNNTEIDYRTYVSKINTRGVHFL
jgi:homoserine kinase